MNSIRNMNISTKSKLKYTSWRLKFYTCWARNFIRRGRVISPAPSEKKDIWMLLSLGHWIFMVLRKWRKFMNLINLPTTYLKGDFWSGHTSPFGRHGLTLFFSLTITFTNPKLVGRVMGWYWMSFFSLLQHSVCFYECFASNHLSLWIFFEIILQV